MNIIIALHFSDGDSIAHKIDGTLRELIYGYTFTNLEETIGCGLKLCGTIVGYSCKLMNLVV
jgi:hypothetical protein